MNTQHTQGRLLAGASLHEGRLVFSAVSRENTRKIVAMTGYCGAADEIESIANTRRLVACWNACEGIPTEVLEAVCKVPLAAVMLAEQRDELLEALKEIATAGVGSVAPGFADIARAAITKVEGKS